MGHVDFEGLSERLFNGFKHKLYLKQIWIITIIPPANFNNSSFGCVFRPTDCRWTQIFFSHRFFGLHGLLEPRWLLPCGMFCSSVIAACDDNNPCNPKNLCEKNAWQDRTSVSICVICGAKDTPKVKSIIIKIYPKWGIKKQITIIKIILSTNYHNYRN